jgi:hypothetical protein
MPPPSRDQRAGSVEHARGGGDEIRTDGVGAACTGGAADAEPDAAPGAPLGFRATLAFGNALFLPPFFLSAAASRASLPVMMRRASSSSSSSEAAAIAAARSLGT